MLALTILVCVARRRRPGGDRAGLAAARAAALDAARRRRSLIGLAAAAARRDRRLAAVDAPGRASDAWCEFKRMDSPGTGPRGSAAPPGENRYQLWSAAVHENATSPLTGTGSGTFEYWWARNGDVDETVRDTHSLYLQTLGELGIVGLRCCPAFVGDPPRRGLDDARGARGGAPQLAAGARRLRRLLRHLDLRLDVADPGAARLDCSCSRGALVGRGRAPLASGRRPRRARRAGEDRRRGRRVLAIAAIAIPLASTSLVRQSEAESRDGDLAAALDTARSAQNVEPGAARRASSRRSCWRQRATSARPPQRRRGAAEREATNWRTWLVLSRIEAERGSAAAAVPDYREGSSLNPRFSLFSN